MKAAGQPARLAPYDTAAIVEPGDVVETTTGRRYLVEEARRGLPRPDGTHRWALETIVMGPDDANPEGSVVHPLFWYPR